MLKLFSQTTFLFFFLTLSVGAANCFAQEPPVNQPLLSGLTISGKQLVPGFDRNTYNYSVDSVGFEVSSLMLTPLTDSTGLNIKIEGITIASGIPLNIPLTVGQNAINIIITGPDSVVAATYTINVYRKKNILTAIVLSTGTLSPAFSPDSLNYKVTVPLATSSIKVTPTANAIAAAIKVNGDIVLSGNPSNNLTLQLSPTPISVTIQTSDDIVKTYNITVKRLGATALLSNLTSNVSFSTLFDPTTFNYTATVSDDISSIALLPIVANLGASIQVNNLPVSGTLILPLTLGNNTIAIKVTGTDAAVKTYTLLINKLAGKTRLSGISLSAGTVTPVFNSQTFSYTAKVGAEVNEINIQPLVANDSVNVTINGVEHDRNAVVKVPLNVGTSNTFTIQVAAANSPTTTYTLVVNRDAYPPAPAINTGSVLVYQGKSGVNYLYSVSVPFEQTYVSLGAVKSILNGITTNPPNTNTGYNSSIKVGVNTLVVQPQGVDYQYTITITRAKQNQTITLAAQSKTYGDGDFSPATASSKLAITYNSSNNNVATIVNGKIHIVGAGTANITASQAGNDIYNAATSVIKALTIAKAPQTITFGLLTRFVTDADFSPSTASSGLSVTYSSSNSKVAIITNNKIHIIGAGTSTITVTQAGNDNFSVVNASNALTVNKLPQTIKVVKWVSSIGDSAFVVATASSNLPVSLTLMESLPKDVYTIIGNKIKPNNTKAGNARFYLKQQGNAIYAAARSFSVVTVVTLKQQTITFNTESKNYGDPDFIPAVNSSGLPLTFYTLNSEIISVVNNKFHIIKPGKAEIIASQFGTKEYEPASNRVVMVVNKGIQTLQFNTANKYIGDADFSPAIISSSLPISYTSSNPNVISVINNKLHINGAGETNITATQSGNAYYTAIQHVTRTITVNKASQIITFPTVAKKYGDADFSPAAASSGLPVAYTSSNAKVATIVSGKLHITGVGTATIFASQAGNTTYTAAKSITQTLTVIKAPLTITADNKTKKAGQANPALTATYKGFVNGDDKNDLGTQPKLVTTAVTSSKAGSYVITASGAASSNYLITYVAGKLTVAASSVKLNDIDVPAQPIVSSALSPNGDGINDVLNIANIQNYPDNTLSVMDVNGNSVYEVKGYDNQNRVFDGHSKKGAMQKPGTYYYILTYKDSTESKRLTGYILIK
ncbi:hypothetical protein FFF34_009000 [Inquilinus sp. KBS0705]|nr:hypothetical protein FFF34_009000 [Inquilinus sp. KBS0705]